MNVSESSHQNALNLSALKSGEAAPSNKHNASFQLPAMPESFQYNKGRQSDPGQVLDKAAKEQAPKGGLQQKHFEQHMRQHEVQQPKDANAAKTAPLATPQKEAPATVAQKPEGAQSLAKENVASHGLPSRAEKVSAEGLKAGDKKPQVIAREHVKSLSAPDGMINAKHGETMVAPITDSRVTKPGSESHLRVTSSVMSQGAERGGSVVLDRQSTSGDNADHKKGREEQGRADNRQVFIPSDQASDAKSVASLRAALGTSNTAQGSGGSLQLPMVNQIMQEMERMRQNGRGSVTLQLPISEGKEVKLNLRMLGNRLQVRLDSPDPAIYDALHKEWPQLAERASQRGISLDAPVFNKNSSEAISEEDLTQTA